nr:SIS domain-containing protein [Clostridia bacterium]
MTEFFDVAVRLLKEADEFNERNIDAVSDLFADCIKNDGIIYMFGCGHSGLIAQDCFYRAGGLANVQPIFVPELMLHLSASNSSKLEKDEKNAENILKDYQFHKHDVLCVFSVSGINGVPIEIAKQGREKGIKVIGLGSSAYFEEISRHSSGKKLADYCDIFLDSRIPKGDAVINLADGGKAVPVSTVISSCLIQTCIAETLKKLEKANVRFEVFGSGNLNANINKNADLVNKYIKRIKSL